MIDPELGYSPKTQELIERMCRNVERKDFVLDKEKSEELILRTYDIFGLPRPKRIVWCNDIFEDSYTKVLENARSSGSSMSAISAISARNARSARNAMSAWLGWYAWNSMSAMSVASGLSARSGWSAWNAMSARLVMSAMYAVRAMSARSARSARSTLNLMSVASEWSAWSGWYALDFDFDYFIFCYEYRENPCGELPNEHDLKYLEYCELLMQAKEAGLGYAVEHDNVLYLAPTPIVRLNDDTPPKFHSDQLPAVAWKNGGEFYFLDGVILPKELWQRIVSKEMSLSEIMAIEISDQRTVALKYNPQAIINENAKLIHADEINNELYLVEGQEINKITKHPEMWFLKMLCPTGRVFIEGVDPEFAQTHQNATECQAELCNLTLPEYLSMKLQS